MRDTIGRQMDVPRDAKAEADADKFFAGFDRPLRVTSIGPQVADARLAALRVMVKEQKLCGFLSDYEDHSARAWCHELCRLHALIEAEDV